MNKERLEEIKALIDQDRFQGPTELVQEVERLRAALERISSFSSAYGFSDEAKIAEEALGK